jgi:hypothetical protein
MNDISVSVTEDNGLIECKIDGQKNIYEQTPEEIKKNLETINTEAKKKYDECIQKLQDGSMSWFPCGFADLYLDADHAKIIKKTALKALNAQAGRYGDGLEWVYGSLLFREAKPYKQRKTIEVDFMPLHSHQELNLKEEVLSAIRNQIALVFGLGSRVETMLD